MADQRHVGNRYGLLQNLQMGAVQDLLGLLAAFGLRFLFLLLLQGKLFLFGPLATLLLAVFFSPALLLFPALGSDCPFLFLVGLSLLQQRPDHPLPSSTYRPLMITQATRFVTEISETAGRTSGHSCSGQAQRRTPAARCHARSDPEEHAISADQRA